MYQMAKSAREKMKAKARSLAAPGTLEKGQDTTQASWSPAEALNADVKTGMRPLSKRAYKAGGKVSGAAATGRADRKPRKSGGGVGKDIGVGMANKNMKEANESREGIKHVGGFKKGGRTARATGGSVPSDKDTQTSKDRVGTIQVKPKRGAAQHYKKGGKIRKADGGYTGGSLPSPEEAIGSEERLKGLKVMPGKSSTAAAQVTPAQLRREEGYSAADMKASRAGRKAGGRYGRDMGGKIKEALGKVTGVKSEAQKLSEGLANVGKGSTASYSQEEREKLGSMAAGRKAGGRKWIQSAIEKPGSLRKAMKVKEGEKIPAKKLEKAAEAPGKMGKRARLAMTLKRMNRATGGATLLSAMKGAAKKVSKKGGKTDINIVINAGRMPRSEDMKPPADMGAMPPPDMGMAPPPPPAMPMAAPAAPPAPMGGIGSPAAAAILGRKAGGRITKVASSYKDMEAGAASGEGRLQKTDIAKKHRDAPARKAGGRISKVAKSYKDMTAGAGSGEGRLQKDDIAKAKKNRAA